MNLYLAKHPNILLEPDVLARLPDCLVNSAIVNWPASEHLLAMLMRKLNITQLEMIFNKMMAYP